MRITANDKYMAKKVIKKFNKGKKTDEQIFYNLCFAILSPQIPFTINRKVVDKLIEKEYYSRNIPDDELEEILRPTRFFRQKKRNLKCMKNSFFIVLNYLKNNWNSDSVKLRDELVDNIRGLGMKAASHFLRNMGHTELSIIDVHILRYLDLDLSSISNRKKYKEVEKLFNEIAEKKMINPAELDAIVWKKYSNTEWKDIIWTTC